MDRRTKSLIFCTLLLNQNLAVVALSLPKPISTDLGQETTVSSPLPCERWEQFNGQECVCATKEIASCTTEGGLVCDNKGNQYRSNCYLALEVCNNKTYDIMPKSCGACDMLRLTDGGVVTTDRNLAIFQKLPNTDDQSRPQYSAVGQDLMVFFDKTLDKWVIGKKNGTESYVGMMQETKSEFPQDSEGGMIVIQPNGTTTSMVVDKNLKMECYNEKFKVHSVQKRFIFVTLAIISVTAVATSTTLRVIQAKKGCLYYPDVCRLRDEIKKKLEPEVKKLKENFQSTYGDIEQYKTEWEGVQNGVLDIRSNLVTVNELQSSLDQEISNTDILLINFENNDIPSNMLAEYNEWKKSANMNAGIAVIAFEFELAMTILTLPSVLATTATMFTVGVAGFFAVVGIAFSVVDVVSSVKEERSIRDKLRKAKSRLTRAKNDFNKAFKTMKEFQAIFCKSAINYLRDVSKKGRLYHMMFYRLYQRITRVFGTSFNACNKKTTHLNQIKQLKKSYMDPLNTYLSSKINQLKQKIKEVKKVNNVLRAIADDVKIQKKNPKKIFDDLRKFQKETSEKLFVNYFNFLKHIAEKVLPEGTCYWGIDLSGIRKAVITSNNYANAAVCKSPEIDTFNKLIDSEVKKEKIPCSILKLVKSDVFGTRTSVLRYIAQHVLPNNVCYWGYDLRPLREQTTGIVLKYETSDVKTTLFSTLSYLTLNELTEENLKTGYSFMCKSHKICDKTWQDFIFCSMVKSSNNVLKCPQIPGLKIDMCIPNTTKFQSC